MSMLNDLLGEQLKRYRERRKLTQDQLSEISGMTRTRISEIERGIANITIDTLDKLLNALEIDPHELFNFSDVARSLEFQTKEALMYSQQELLKDLSVNEIRFIYNNTKAYIETIQEKK